MQLEVRFSPINLIVQFCIKKRRSLRTRTTLKKATVAHGLIADHRHSAL